MADDTKPGAAPAPVTAGPKLIVKREFGVYRGRPGEKGHEGQQYTVGMAVDPAHAVSKWGADALRNRLQNGDVAYENLVASEE